MKRDELISKTRDKMRLENYALDTIDAYTSVARNFFNYLVRHPETREMDHTHRMESYLTWRVLHGNISPSTQNVEFNALLYLGRKILGVEIGEVNAMRAKPRQRIPHIINSVQVSQLLEALPMDLSRKLTIASCLLSCHNRGSRFARSVCPLGFDLAPRHFPDLRLGPANACRLTMRAPDKWESARFIGFFPASSFSLLPGGIQARPLAGNACR